MGEWHITSYINPQQQAYTYKLEFYELFNNVLFQRHKNVVFQTKWYMTTF